MFLQNLTIRSFILATSIIATGCSTVPLPQDVTNTVAPEYYSMISNNIEGRDSENKMALKFEYAELDSSEVNDEMIITFGGRFYHSNPKIKTDSPFIGIATVDLIHHGDGIISIKNANAAKIELLSIHSPIKSLVQKESEIIFKNAVKEIEGKYLSQQQVLRLQDNFEKLFN